ncbi:MAG: hypothetical protein NC517_02810 [Firmicutes bacterium]|nr:hypothetical protein [Bacillota bacterium]
MTEQIGYEWKKIIGRKSLVFLMAAFVFLSLILYFARLWMPEFGSGIRPAAYRQAAVGLAGQDGEEAYIRVRETMEAILYRGEWPGQYGQTPGEAYFLCEFLSRELSQVSGYEAYIEGILETAEKRSGGFLGADAESRRLNDRIFKDFSDLRGVSLAFTGSCGIYLFWQADLWDAFLCMVLMLFVYALVLTEYEEGKMSLMRAAPRGREACFGAKLLLGFCFVTVLQTGVQLMRFLLSVAAFGCPDLTAPIQTVYGAGSCPWTLSVGQGLLLFWGGKTLGSVILYCLLVFLALLCRDGRLFYGLCGGGAAVFLLCYTQIDTNSFLVNLKWLNPAAFLDTGRLLTEYRNIQVLGHPVGYPLLATVIGIAVLPFLICGSLGLYKSGLPGRRIPYTGMRGVGKLRGRGLGSMEHRKYWTNQGLAGICLAYLLLAAAVYTPLTEGLYTKTEIYYKTYVTQREGPYSEEKLQSLYQERERLDKIEALLASGENYHASVIDYYQTELERQGGLEAAVRYVEYVRDHGDTILYEAGFRQLLGQGDGRLALLLCRLASLALMCLFSVTIWHYDRRTGMEKLIRISRTGSKGLERYQYGNVLWAGCLIFAITYLPWIYNVSSAYSVGFPAAAAKSLEMFAFLPGWISIGLLYGVFYGAHLLYLLVAGWTAKWVCRKINHSVGASLALFAAFMLPILLQHFCL